jgi:hypothetical protein
LYARAARIPALDIDRLETPGAIPSAMGVPPMQIHSPNLVREQRIPLERVVTPPPGAEPTPLPGPVRTPRIVLPWPEGLLPIGPLPAEEPRPAPRALIL